MTEAIGGSAEAPGGPAEAMGRPSGAPGGPAEAVGGPPGASGAPAEALGAPTEAPASPRPAVLLMIATYVLGAVGVFVGFSTLNASPPSLRWAALIAVGGAGVLSFVRHALFHRSDAARMGWSMGRRNNFQIEVGIANLAWGLVAILAAVLDWGLAAQAVTFLVFGLYLGGCAIMLVTTPSAERTRPWRQVVGMAAFAVALLWLGFAGMAAAG